VFFVVRSCSSAFDSIDGRLAAALDVSNDRGAKEAKGRLVSDPSFSESFGLEVRIGVEVCLAGAGVSPQSMLEGWLPVGMKRDSLQLEDRCSGGVVEGKGKGLDGERHIILVGKNVVVVL